MSQDHTAENLTRSEGISTASFSFHLEFLPRIKEKEKAQAECSEYMGIARSELFLV